MKEKTDRVLIIHGPYKGFEAKVLKEEGDIYLVQIEKLNIQHRYGVECLEMNFKKGDRVKIEPRSQAAIEVFRNNRKREKWENVGLIGFVTGIMKAPAGNKLVRVSVRSDDPNGDYFFPGDLRLVRLAGGPK